MSVPLVKICGITCREDALAAVRCGASALGFNVWPGSRRCIDPRREAGWIRELPALVTRVAVTVDPGDAEVSALAALGCFDAVQLHGDEPPEFVAALRDAGIRVFKALRLRDEGVVRQASSYLAVVPTLLVDAFVPGAFGGTGEAVDPGLARAVRDVHPTAHLILAGGLTPENVAAAVAAVQPDAVDVAGGVEHPGDPRRKDPVRMAAFVAAARGGL